MIKIWPGVLALLALSSSAAFAIENLPCQRLLDPQTYELPDGTSVTLAANQVLVRGILVPHWETGMEDQTDWSVFDHHINSRLSGSGYDASFSLNTGARVFVLNEDGSVLAQGYYKEIFLTGQVRFGTKVVDVNPNRPLLTSADGSRTILSVEQFVALFKSKARAVAIVDLGDREMAWRNETLAPKFAMLKAHLKDPTRWLNLGSGQRYERKFFEQVYYGKLVPQERGVHVIGEGVDHELHYGDCVHFIGAQGESLGQWEVQRYPAILDEHTQDLNERAAICVLIQKIH